MVPVLVQVPPTIGRFSIISVRRPAFTEAMAARWPAGPLPITMTSYRE
jgi:hypothetical protein